MSAWIVNKAHVDCLVQAMIVEGIVSTEQADETGRLLWEENVTSVQHYYGGETRETLPGQGEYTDPATYRFSGVEAPLDDLIVWRQLDCYEYQTCEHDGWREGTEWDADTQRYSIVTGARRRARALHDALDGIYRSRFGVDSSYDVPYDGLPWGIDDLAEAVKR